jgi:ribonuclease BN (tRNA processing enzyme)
MAGLFASKVNARNLLLTHFGHAIISTTEKTLKEEAEETFKNPIHIAEDSMSLHITSTKEIIVTKNKTRD